MPRLRTMTIQGGRAAFFDVGQGPAILFVHGFPLSSSMWRGQLEYFQTKYRVIVPDLPGFGQSESLLTDKNGSLTMEFLADWLAELLELIDCVDPVHFCGLSMGGYIGWQFWKRHTKRVKSVIACNTRAAGDTDLIRRGREIAARQVMVTGAQPVADVMVKKLFYQEREGLHQTDFFNEIHAIISSAKSASVAAGQRGMAKRKDATEWLSSIKVPMLFVAGQHDLITPADEMLGNAKMVENAQHVLIGNAGHMSPLENTSAFNSALDDFLAINR